jgi:septum formation protein
MNLILASASPRRTHLLKQIGLRFTVVPAHVDESIDELLPPYEHVTILAERKARAVAQRLGEGVVLGADTIVVLDGGIINKPADAADARRMLRMLSGRRHEVYTGFTLMDASDSRSITGWERTEVWFRVLEDQEIAAYVAAGSPMDKAGAYGIQDDYGAVFVEKISGDFYNVVGLPLCRVFLALREFTNGETI